jgi:hypothetical protein
VHNQVPQPVLLPDSPTCRCTRISARVWWFGCTNSLIPASEYFL